MPNKNAAGLFNHTYPFILLPEKSENDYKRIHIHELAHCWHIYGSSIGTLYEYLSTLMYRHLADYLKGDEVVNRHSRLSVNVPIITEENARGWFLTLKLLHLFTKGSFPPATSMQLPICQFNKDYIDCFYHFTETTTSENFNKTFFEEDNPNKNTYKRSIEKTILNIARVADKSINVMHPKFKNFQNNTHLDYQANLLTINDLVEDYACLLDTIYTHGGLNTDKFETICNDMQDSKAYGESFRWFAKYNFWERTDNPYLDLIVSYIMAMEIALMTSFHPCAFFFKPLKPLEIYPPIRFCAILQHWNEIVGSISSLGDSLICLNDHSNSSSLSWINSKRFLVFADLISEKYFNWLPYTFILKNIKTFIEAEYDPTLPEEKYIMDIGIHIIDKKLSGIIIDFDELQSIPIKTISKDDFVKKESFDLSEKIILSHCVYDWVFESFSIDLTINNDYKQTEKRIETLKQYISPDIITNCLDDSEISIDKYINSGLHTNPFLKKSDMEDNFLKKKDI